MTMRATIPYMLESVCLFLLQIGLGSQSKRRAGSGTTTELEVKPFHNHEMASIIVIRVGSEITRV